MLVSRVARVDRWHSRGFGRRLPLFVHEMDIVEAVARGGEVGIVQSQLSKVVGIAE